MSGGSWVHMAGRKHSVSKAAAVRPEGRLFAVFWAKAVGNVNCPIVRQEELGEGLVIKLIFLRKSGMSRLETKEIM